MNSLKIALTFLLLVFGFSLLAQNKAIEKANKRYQIKKYAEAIPLYEEGLAKNPSLTAKTKLAFCYRINNNIDKAAELYADIVQQERARAITYYYYGETLMSQGKYEDAKIWLEKYTKEKPDDSKGWTLLESVAQVQNIQPYFQVGAVDAFSGNSASDDSAPVMFRDGLIFSSDRKTGLKVMKKKSGWTGRDFLKLYYAKGNGNGTYGSAKSLSRRLNDLNKNTGTITIAPDGKSAVFSRNSDVSNRKNIYNLMLYSADITSEGKFKNVRLLSFCSNNANYMHPTFSPDGETLFFTSDKKGVGGTDIFYSTLGKKGWRRPKNVGEPVNTLANEGFPFVSQDGKLYFCSKGHLSYGGFDIFMSEQDEKGNWKQPINVGMPINSSSDDISIFIAPDGKNGFFASSREGGDDDIYAFEILGTNKVSPIKLGNERPLTDESKSNDISNTSVVSNEKEEVNNNTSTNPENTTSDLPTLPFDANKENLESVASTPAEVNNNTSTNLENTNSNLPTLPFDANKENLESVATTPTEVNNNTSTNLENTNSESHSQSIDATTGNLETVLNASTEINNNTSTNLENTNSDLPSQPIDAPTEEVEIKEFNEGLASVDTPMTEEKPVVEIIPTPAFENEGLMELKDYLSRANPQEEAIFLLEKVKFEPKQYVVKDKNKSYLEELYTMLMEHPELKIEVTAHTESIGEDRENMVVSIKRATAIAGYLIRKGIATDRLKVMGYGETQLLNHCSNGVDCSAEEHALNQRIEIKVVE